jgi:hypothetical protein
VIRALAAALLLAGCATTHQAVTHPVTPGVCHVEVSFGSYAMGVDGELKARIQAVVEADEDVLDVEETRWGREGESTLCISTLGMPAADRLYAEIATLIPERSARAPTTISHLDGRSHGSTYPE